MIEKAWAEDFAQKWIEAWNAHDLERILSHYTEDFEMSSPLIIQRMREPSGVLRGKVNIRPYWEIGLAQQPPLHFQLLEVLVGVNSLVLHYRTASGRLAAEVLTFNEEGQLIKGNAHYSGL
jgi:ketosteroid isomerase-like protein